jgi:hypothetical protein
VSIDAEEEGAGGVLHLAIENDGLGGGEDVVLVEGGVEGGASMAGGAEGYSLGGVRGIGVEAVVSGFEFCQIDKGGWMGASGRVDAHGY